MTKLLDHLLSLRAEGRKLLVPYLMAGVPQRDSYGPALVACSEDADAVEVGLPYSDPLMDGPVIASAGERAIRDGIGPIEALELTAGLGGSAPLIAMTYYNPIYRVGERAFCARASRAGVTGLIVPDLPLEESAGIRNAARARPRLDHPGRTHLPTTPGRGHRKNGNGLRLCGVDTGGDRRGTSSRPWPPRW